MIIKLMEDIESAQKGPKVEKNCSKEDFSGEEVESSPLETIDEGNEEED
jgi:hypothetical protein